MCVCMCARSIASVVFDFVTLWTLALQAPLTMRFFRQEYWSGFPCPSPGDLPNPAIKPVSLMTPALTVGFFTTNVTWEALLINSSWKNKNPRETSQLPKHNAKST